MLLSDPVIDLDFLGLNSLPLQKSQLNVGNNNVPFLPIILSNTSIISFNEILFIFFFNQKKKQKKKKLIKTISQ